MTNIKITQITDGKLKVLGIFNPDPDVTLSVGSYLVCVNKPYKPEEFWLSNPEHVSYFLSSLIINGGRSLTDLRLLYSALEIEIFSSRYYYLLEYV